MLKKVVSRMRTIAERLRELYRMRKTALMWRGIPKLVFPQNWTVRDLEKQFPSHIRARESLFELSFELLPRDGPDPRRRFQVKLNLDERDSLEADLEQLVKEGVLGGFRISQSSVFDFTMCLTMIRVIRQSQQRPRKPADSARS